MRRCVMRRAAKSFNRKYFHASSGSHKTNLLVKKTGAPMTPLYKSESGLVKIFRVRSLDKFRQITGRLPYQFEQMECIGCRISDNMVGGDCRTELFVGSWDDLVVEVDGRTSRDSKEYFPIRLGDAPVDVTRVMQGDVLTLTNLEAALTRFALSACSLSGYMSQFGDDSIRPFHIGHMTSKEAAEYFYMAMFAGNQFGFSNMFRYLN